IFVFQAEDGIRDPLVTGVQTCALPILLQAGNSAIFLPDPGTTTFRAIVAVGEVADAIKATVIEGGVGIIGSLLQSGKPELVNDRSEGHTSEIQSRVELV